MNATIFSEIDSKAISHLKNEIKQNKILIEKLTKQNELMSTTWDEMNENFLKITDYNTNIQKLEKKILTIIYKNF